MSSKEKGEKNNFPARKVINTSLTIKPSISCGIIAFAKDTQRWLIVRRRYSVAFSIILRGAFRKGDLEGIINHLTDTEVGYTRMLLDPGEDPNDLLQQLIPVLSSDDRAHTIDRLTRNMNEIKQLLDGLTSFKSSEWIFPKGKTKDSRESFLECAKREFNEEAGFEAKGYIHNQPLTDEYTGFSSRPYQTIWWLCQLENEVKLVQPLGDFEIVERKWIAYSEASDYLSERVRDVLDRAISLMND